MKNIFLTLWLLALSSCLPLSVAVCASELDVLAKEFADPPRTARPWVYWFIMDGNLSREGITADLEAMEAAGIGGVIIMEVNVGIPRGKVEFMSDAWCALFKHAVQEAERLGLEITLNAGPGWTGSGGPWVKAEQSMQHLVASSTDLTGPLDFDAVLPQPAPREPYFGSAGLPVPLLQARRDFYRDVAVLAVPYTDENVRVEDVDEKALYLREPYTSKPGVKPYLPALATYERLPREASIPADKVIDLTDRLQADGRLAWSVPAGRWTILRFGRCNTGANTRPAPLPGLGFECDKFDRAALDAHYDAFVGKLLRTIGPRPGDRSSGWTMLHIDSWEMGSQNWTAHFRDEFQRRRGYDLLRYLPVMTGRIVDSREVSERFLWDLRLTAQDLVIDNHAQYLKELGHRDGFGLSIEPYDMNPTSDMTLGGVADVPMCEFWSHGFGFDATFSCIEATSIAHTRGRKIVAAEAFTATSREAWQLFPGRMKDQGDWAFCTGINRLAFHRFAHQPWLDRRPGMTMGPYGVHWDRTQTWWPLVSAYHQYVARCQHLLRQGVNVADICYLIPEGAPHVFRPPASALEGELGDRRGYNFDGCAPETLCAEAAVKDGRIVFPSGASYRLLMLPAFETMTPELLATVKRLALSGATVVGPRPRKSPSLTNYPQCDREVELLAESLWGASADTSCPIRREVGRGEVVWGGDLRTSQGDPSLPTPIEQARWIWFPEGNPAVSAEPSICHFRHTFELAPGKRVQSARIQITADNSFELWVNGQVAGGGDNFHEVFNFDVTKLLRPGQNLLAVSATNGGDDPNPAGVIAALDVRYQDGHTLTLPTNGQWRAARHPQARWQQQLGPPDSRWLPAEELGSSEMAPWHLKATTDPCPVPYPDYEATVDLLQQLGLPADFEADGPIRYTHRRSAQWDLYFVANRTAEQLSAMCRFRVTGREPELWDPVRGTTGRRTEFSQHAGQTSVSLHFHPYQSFFVLFRARGGAELENRRTARRG